jgi:hypothetical protein
VNEKSTDGDVVEFRLLWNHFVSHLFHPRHVRLSETHVRDTKARVLVAHLEFAWFAKNLEALFHTPAQIVRAFAEDGRVHELLTTPRKHVQRLQEAFNVIFKLVLRLHLSFVTHDFLVGERLAQLF